MLVLTISTALATTSLTQDFGSLTSSGCSTAWSGDCETGWDAVGPAGSVSACSSDGDDLVWLTPDSVSASSGLRRTFTLAADDASIDWGADVDVLEQGELTLEILFRDASGALLHTEDSVQILDQGNHLVTLNGSRPPTATSAEVRIRFRGLGLGLGLRSAHAHGFPALGTCDQRAQRIEDVRRVLCESKTNEHAAFFYEGECVPVDSPTGCLVVCSEDACRALGVPPLPTCP